MAHQREPSGSSDQASYADPRMPTKSPLISGVTKKKTPPPGFAVIKSQGYVATDVCPSKSQGYITPDVCSNRSQGYIAPDGNLEATSTKRKREINCNKHGTDPDKQFVYGYDSYVSGVHDSGSTDSYPSPPSDNFFNLPSDFDVSSLSTWKTDAVYEDLFDVSNPCITDALHCIPKDNGRIPDNAEDTPNAGSTLHLPKGPESVDLSLEDMIQKVEYAFKQNEWDMPSSEQVLPNQLLGEGGTHIGGNDTHSGNRQMELYFQSLLGNVREEDLTNHEESSSRNGSFHQINPSVHRAGNLTAEELGDCSLLTPDEKVLLDMLISKIKQRKLDSNTRKKSNPFKDATREEVEQRVNSAESRGSSSTTEHVLANNKHFPIPEVVRKRSQDDQIGGSLFDSTATTVEKRDHSGTSKNQLLTGPTPSKSAKLQQEQSLKKQKKHELVSVVNPTDVHEGREDQRFEKQTDDLEDMEIEDFDEKPGADGGLFLGPYSGSNLINLQGHDQGVCEPPKKGKIPSNLLKKKKNKRKSSVGTDRDHSQQRNKRNQGNVSEAVNVSTMDVTVGTDRDHPQHITEQVMHSTDDKTPQQVVSSWNDNEGGKNAKLGSNEPRSRWIQQHGTLGHFEVNQVTNDENFKGSLQNQKPHESTLQAEAHNKVESIRSSYAAASKERCSPPAEVVHKSPKETSVERKEQTYFETDWVVVPSQHKAHSKPANKHSDFTEQGSKEHTGGNRDKIENGKKLRMPGSLDSRSRTRVTKEELKTDMKETHAAGDPVLPPTKRKEQSRKERIKATSLKDSKNNAHDGDDLTGLSSSVLKSKQSQETDNGWQRVQKAEVPSQAATNPGKSSKREEKRSKGMKQRERNMSEESCKGEDNGSVSHGKTTFQKRSRSYNGNQKDSQSSDKANAFDYGKATGKEKDVGSGAGKVPSGVKQKHNNGRHGNVDKEDKCRDQKTENLTQTGKPRRDSASKFKKEIPHGGHAAFKHKDQQAKARKDKKSSFNWNDIFFNHLQAMVKLSKEGSIFVICLLQIVGMCLAAHAYATFDYFQYLIMALASDAIDCCQTLVPFIINHFVKHLWPYVLKPIWFVAILLVLIVVLCGKAIYQCLQWLAWCVFRVFSQEGKFGASSSSHHEQFQQDFGSFGQRRDFPNKCNTDQEGTFTGSTFSDMGSHGNSTDNNQGCNSETTDNGYEPGDPGTGNARTGTSNDADEAIRSILNATDGPFEVLGVNVIDTQEVIKKEYRRLAILVHPDKNKHPDAQRAFQILQAAHDKIGDEESRLNYIRENQNIAFAQDVADECERQFEVLRSTIHCECGLFHRMTKTDRSPLFARFCSTHGTYHQAYENDVWTETSCLGLKVHCYLCQSGVVYDATYWASCQKLLGALEPNGCRVRVKIGPTSHSQNNPSSDFEDFMHRFGSAPPRGGRSRQSGNHYPNKKKKNKRSGRR